MRFISVRDLNTKPKEIWNKIKDEEVVITSNGKPIALLSGVTEETLEKTLRAIRRSRALHLPSAVTAYPALATGRRRGAGLGATL